MTVFMASWHNGLSKSYGSVQQDVANAIFAEWIVFYFAIGLVI